MAVQDGGPDEIRTRNPGKEPEPKSGAYTNFATGPPLNRVGVRLGHRKLWRTPCPDQQDQAIAD